MSIATAVLVSSIVAVVPASARETVCIAWGETYQLPADKILTFKHCAHDIDDSQYANLKITATNPTGDTTHFFNNPEELMPSLKLGGSIENVSDCPPCPMVLCGPAAIYATMDANSTGETVNFFQLVVSIEDLSTAAGETPTTIPTCASLTAMRIHIPYTYEITTFLDRGSAGHASGQACGAGAEPKPFLDGGGPAAAGGGFGGDA